MNSAIVVSRRGLESIHRRRHRENPLNETRGSSAKQETVFPVRGKPQLSTRIFGVLIEPRDRQLLCRSNGHGGEREEWRSRRDYPHEVHGYRKKTQYCLGLIPECSCTTLMDGAISRVHLRNIFFFSCRPNGRRCPFEEEGLFAF